MAGPRPRLREGLLDAEAPEPVGEVADGLVIGEVGLVDPALGLLAADPPGGSVGRVEVVAGVGLDGEPGVVDGVGRSTTRGGAVWMTLARASSTAPAMRKVSSRSPVWAAVEISTTGQPIASTSGRTSSARSAASGTSTLFSATIRGRDARSVPSAEV